MYVTNPRLPKLRAKAVMMVRRGKSVRQVARYFGFNPSTISRWDKKMPRFGSYDIRSRSSRPYHHPKELSQEIVKRIVTLRKETHGRCAEVIHKYLINEGVKVSLSSVKRTLDRKGLIKRRSIWKRYHKFLERPKVFNPGDLIQLDTIHLMKNEKERIYVYTLIDLHSRWAYAKACRRINCANSIQFVKEARDQFPFNFRCLQSDHGPEFSELFTERVRITHRHSRVRRPNDNAHLERFNRTLADELLRNLPPDVNAINQELPRYLNYYNKKRLHMGINFQTPVQMLA